MKRLLLLLILLASRLPACAQAAPQHLRLSLISDANGLQPGRTQEIGIHFQLDPGWHIYWTNPGDSGEPPRVSWHLPQGLTVGELRFPTPRRIEAHSLTDFGYQDDVILLAELTVPKGFAGQSADIAADVRWLVCREVCIPGRGSVSAKLRAGQSDARGDVNLIRAAEQKLPQPAPSAWKLSAAQRGSSILMNISGAHGLVVSDFIPAEPLQIDNSSRPTVRRTASGIQLVLKKSDQAAKALHELRGILISAKNGYAVTIPVSQSSIN